MRGDTSTYELAFTTTASRQPPARVPTAAEGLSGWQVAGIVLLVVTGILGLAIFAAVIAFAVALNSWGNNK